MQPYPPPYLPFPTTLTSTCVWYYVFDAKITPKSKILYIIYALIKAANKGRTFGRFCHNDSNTASHLVDNLTPPPQKKILLWNLCLNTLFDNSSKFLKWNQYLYIHLNTLSMTWISILLDCLSSYFIVLQVDHNRGYIRNKDVHAVGSLTNRRTLAPNTLIKGSKHTHRFYPLTILSRDPPITEWSPWGPPPPNLSHSGLHEDLGWKE